VSDDVWQVGDPAPGTKASVLGALDPLIGTPRRQPVDLAEFLLARIAEDEAEIAAGFDFAVLDSSGWMGHAAGWGRERALAECDAKARIVEDLRDELTNQHDPEPTTLQLAERTLLSLALPYADHPDYREEWRS
jgi:hypothetical protein